MARGAKGACSDSALRTRARGALVDPRTVPVRVILPDVRARFVRLDTPAFTAAAVTIYGPG